MNTADTQKKKSGFLGIGSWVLFDWAGQPFYTLVTTFLFAPYFVNFVVGDKEEGQVIWGIAAAIAGILVALLSPVLGAIADAAGRRKPWVFGFFVIQLIAMCALWYAAPGDKSTIIPVMVAFIIATVCAEFAIVFTNAMMTELVPEKQLGRLSGIAYGVGYAGGLVALIYMVGFIIANPDTGKTLLGLEPHIDFNIAEKEGDRFAGPFSAIWYAVFAIPFFLFTRDMQVAKQNLSSAIDKGLTTLKATFIEIRHYKNIVLYLIARMLYTDGLAALLTFGGIYAVSTFAWQTLETGLFGIYLAAVGAIGAFIGGFLDDRLGAKKVIFIGLFILCIATIGIVSIDKDHIFFVYKVAPNVEGDGLFASIGERLYLAFSFLIGIVFGPIYSSSRTLMARISPEDKMTEFFGFFAFSGKVTAFLAPAAISAVTYFSDSQRMGISVIIAFFIIGLILMIGVKEKRIF